MDSSASTGATPEPSPDDLRRWLEIEAQRLGFDLFGVTTPDAPPHLDVYENWLSAGRQGEMAYLAAETARQRRADPRSILPECRSILVLATRYPSPGEAPAPDLLPSARQSSPVGKVASYAWGDDYHDVLVGRLRQLVAALEKLLGYAVPNRCYTDTGPLLERELAQRAGLGWIGKNTCLIHPRLGSYFFLAEILLALDLPPDHPFIYNRCGSCTRCIDACPTGCILPDRTLDALRCISYLTIELKGAIPDDLRPQVGDWVFGCDVCQQVCPWNRFAGPEGDPAFSPRSGLPRPDLLHEMTLTAEQFHHKFKASAVRRAKRRGYLRNVAVALGNRAGQAAETALLPALRHDVEPLVRAHAAWALGRLGGKSIQRSLQNALDAEGDESVCQEIRRALVAPAELEKLSLPHRSRESDDHAA
jgi:epoxyqueuosine reductase